ncbi:zinc transporter ZIP1-like [Tubulanus polymorphus]|uniref:zinc transporter ZIP1-like n=1 Tax=Tubulanus polymorphus TaxID=672921 RepID=UPI003DA65DD1
MSLPIEAVKGLVLAGLLVMTFTFSMLPLKFVSVARHVTGVEGRHKWSRIISFLSCYAAGVFLGTCLLDLFPDVRGKLVETFDNMGVVTNFPISEFVMVFGLFLILITEQIVLSVKEAHEDDEDAERSPLLGHGHSHGGPHHQPDAPTASLLQHDHHHHHFEESIEGIFDQPISRNHSSESLLNTSYVNDSSTKEPDHSIHVDRSSHSPVRAIILLLALSLHSVFEGLAVGLQPNTNAVLQIFLALFLHKCILAFSLGLNLVQSRLTVKAIVKSNLLFSIMSPLGIGIGILVNDMSDSIYSNLANGILQGIACGTFLYVTFFEVLPHEFNSSDDRLLKLLFLLLGYGTVTGLLFLDPPVVHSPPLHGKP